MAWIRVGALGDLLISTAALKETHLRFPNAEIWIVGSPLWRDLLEPKSWPFVTRVIVTNDGRRGEVYRPKENEWVLSLQNQSVFSFYWQCQATVNHRPESYRFAWGPFFAQVPIRLGSCPPAMSWLYTHWSPWLGKDPLIHERDAHLQIVEAKKTSLLGHRPSIEAARAELKRSPGPLAEKWTGQGLPALRSPRPDISARLTGEVPPKKYWLLNPTSSRREKAWSSLRFKEVVNALRPILKAKGRELFVVGAPSETDWLNEVATEGVIQPQSIAELIALVGDAEQVITNTSSLQYIAASTQTPALVLMGRAIPEIWGPLGAKDKIIRGGDFHQLKETSIFEQEVEAYRAITVDQVLNVCSKILDPL